MHRYLLFLLILCSCYAEELQEEMSEDPFFDLASYIDNQVDSLQRAGGTVTKTISLNGTTETKELDDLNYANDLRVFRESEINKPAWVDKYTVDRQESDGLLTRTYTATDSSMQTRKLTVVSRNDTPISVDILKHTGTVLSNGRHHLTYRPTSGYRLRTMQENRFGDDLDADIRVVWK